MTDNQPIEVGVKFRSDDRRAGSPASASTRAPRTPAPTSATCGRPPARSSPRPPSPPRPPRAGSRSTSPPPVAITANTTYVASYYSSSGYFAIDSGYFATTGVDNPPLHALQVGGANGPNGVYQYGASGFPNGGNTANYWVDVVFATEHRHDGTDHHREEPAARRHRRADRPASRSASTSR